MLKKYLFILFFFSFIFKMIWAQPTQQEKYYESEIAPPAVESSAWEKASAGIDYANEMQKSIKKKTNKKDKGNNSALWANFFKFLGIILLIALMAVLLLHFLGATDIFDARAKKLKPTTLIDLNNVEENLKEADMEALIRRAILIERDYKLALRLYYLYVLKELSERQWIKWRREKTNQEYLHELSEHSMAIPFGELTRIFERIWYGEHNQIQEQNFGLLESKFRTFIQAIQQQKKQ